jgi:hypothetical protein
MVPPSVLNFRLFDVSIKPGAATLSQASGELARGLGWL